MAYHIVFEDLPPSTRRPSNSEFRHADAARKLKAQPNEWARVQKRKKRGDAATAAYQIRNGLLAAFRPAGAFEAKSKTVGDDYFVYARYVGGASPSDGFQ
ncbi:hypothetical protein ACWGLE_16135 [Streptomyces sp. NPDC055897]